MSDPLLWATIYFGVQILLGLPIGFVLISTVVVWAFFAGADMSLMAERVIFASVENIIVIAIPLFIFTAKVMDHGGISERLLRFCLALVGHRPGGLAQVNIVSSVIFSGMSGDATSDASGIGQVLIKMMREQDRYPPAYAAAVTVASSCIGPIIPPSIPMLVYAFFSGASVGALFLAGIVPGLLMGVAMMVLVARQARRRGFPTEKRMARAAMLSATLAALGPLMMPVILLGGIYSGAFTPTEAAAVAGLYAILLSVFLYRRSSWSGLYAALSESARQSGMVFLLIGGGFALNYVFTVEKVTEAITTAILSFEITQMQLLFLVHGAFVVMGMFLTKAPMMYVVIPALLPGLAAAGVDMVHFGVIITLNMMVSMITPPMGLMVFIVGGLARIPIGQIFRESIPFMLTLYAVMILITAFPELVLWLPGTFE
ncbi:TRAP transporter large permease [Jannaschia aquimarina]|uniref:TRAP transporter large permease protein n=1 Tax=Jannaschia aquimarina TaxID=935700 RepID=A0A0D1EGP8_9RHOB|nr:TRAP transporter large permease [Jannaschia aquimarina]KIT15025.1 Sialic acid TRAP transporter permease protein SiaT [Jannaschia aquimarina]SNS62225.1 TRAP transporter, DctM subunit [Jannaschia aquimarina]